MHRSLVGITRAGEKTYELRNIHQEGSDLVIFSDWVINHSFNVYEFRAFLHKKSQSHLDEQVDMSNIYDMV